MAVWAAFLLAAPLGPLLTNGRMQTPDGRLVRFATLILVGPSRRIIKPYKREIPARRSVVAANLDEELAAGRFQPSGQNVLTLSASAWREPSVWLVFHPGLPPRRPPCEGRPRGWVFLAG